MPQPRQLTRSKLVVPVLLTIGAIACSYSAGCVAYQVYSGVKMAKKGVDYVEEKLDDDDKPKPKSTAPAK